MPGCSVGPRYVLQLNLKKNKKIANNSTTTEGAEKTSFQTIEQHTLDTNAGKQQS